MRLYEYAESGNSHKIRLLLSFLGLAYESVEIDLMADEQHHAAFLAINPRGEVPVLEDEGTVLRDSLAILVYVAMKYDEGVWLPRDPQGMGEVMEWLAFAASWIQYGVFTARALVAFGIPGNGLPADYPGDLEEARRRGILSLRILEQHLSGREWLCGRSPTIADIACFPYIALAPMGEISLAPYPAIQRWIARFKTLPGYLDMPGLEQPDYRKAAPKTGRT
jgi:glutathione S-transferase